MRALMGWSLSAILLLGTAAKAEDDPMEVQRCIWRCLADSKGADDPAYHRCAAKFCSGRTPPAPKQSKAKAARNPTPATDGTWTYGRHPALGLGAHVSLGKEAYGLVCVNRPGIGYSGAVRVTRGLVTVPGEDSNAITSFSQPFSVASAATLSAGTDAYFEEMGDACTLPVDRLRNSKELVYLKGSKPSLPAEPGGTVLEYQRNGAKVRVSNQAELDAVADKIVIPLKGSSKAIDRLLAACPTLRRSLAEGCGD